MATRLRIALIVVVVVLAAYTGAAWLIGINVQSRLESREQQALKNARYVVLIKRDYRRGIFGATEESTYGLVGPLARLAALGSAAGSSGPALQLTVRNTIHHGPLPQLRSADLATADTEILLPPRVAQALHAALGGRPTVTIHTRLGWLGGSTTDISVPTFRAQLPTGATVIWQGLDGSGETTRNLETWGGQLVFGGLGVRSALGTLDIGDTSFDANMRRAFDTIYVGDANASVASVDYQGASRAPFLVKGLSMSTASQVDSEYVNYEIRVAADQMKTGSFSFSHLVYGLRILHLEGTSLAALSQALRQVQASAGPGGVAAAQAGVRDALSRYGVDLLVHDPVIQIQSLAFALPEGEFHLAASVSAHGIQRQDLTGGAVGMIALARYLNAAVELRIDDALLTKLLASTSRGPAFSAQLDSWEKQGYLKRDGKAWTAQLALQGGQLTINGQAFPPVAGP